MILQDRIKTLVEYSGLTIPKFSAYVGFKTPQAVRELIKGNTKTLSDSAIHKIIIAYPEISEDWLLTGEGEMLKPNFKVDEIEIPTKEELKQVLVKGYWVPLDSDGSSRQFPGRIYWTRSSSNRLSKYYFTCTGSGICNHDQWRLNGA